MASRLPLYCPGHCKSPSGRLQLRHSPAKVLAVLLTQTLMDNEAMELPKEAVYSHWRQRFAWWLHYLKARQKPKERPRVRRLAGFIPEGGVIFDIGAHFGYLAKEFAVIHNGSCMVHCFEPVPYTRSILERVVDRFQNVHIESRALSNQAGHMKLSIPIKESGRLGIGLAHFGDEVRRDYIVEPVETLTLDAYVAEQGLARLDFVKMDVEGAEFQILQGAEKTLKELRPHVYCELISTSTARMGYKPETVFDFLTNLGYRAAVIERSGEKRPVEGLIEGEEDYLFYPERAEK